MSYDVRVVLALAVLLALNSAQVAVDAVYVPASKGNRAAISVTLQPADPNVHVNETPAPRLKLDAAQKVLVDKQAAPKPADAGPESGYLDPAFPVLFPVELKPGAPKGTFDVPATVTYFYCSKTEGWCRKGTADVTVPVAVK